MNKIDFTSNEEQRIQELKQLLDEAIVKLNDSIKSLAELNFNDWYVKTYETLPPPQNLVDLDPEADVRFMTKDLRAAYVAGYYNCYFEDFSDE